MVRAKPRPSLGDAAFGPEAEDETLLAEALRVALVLVELVVEAIASFF
jgi:hypothetical protein